MIFEFQITKNYNDWIFWKTTDVDEHLKVIFLDLKPLITKIDFLNKNWSIENSVRVFSRFKIFFFSENA